MAICFAASSFIGRIVLFYALQLALFVGRQCRTGGCSLDGILLFVREGSSSGRYV